MVEIKCPVKLVGVKMRSQPNHDKSKTRVYAFEVVFAWYLLFSKHTEFVWNLTENIRTLPLLVQNALSVHRCIEVIKVFENSRE